MSIDLAAIKARCEAATAGPWRIWREMYNGVRKPFAITAPGRAAVLSNDSQTLEDTDAEFIAAAREDVPALVAEVERLQAALRESKRIAIAYADAVEACAKIHDVARAALGETP